MNYPEQYHKLIEELTELEDKFEELQHEFSMKKKEESEKKLQCRILDDKLGVLNSKIETMQFSKKLNKLSTTFASLSVVFPSAIMFLTMIITGINNNDALQDLAHNLFIGLPISVVSMLATMYIGKKIVQKEVNKIKSSEEYKRVLEEIKNKEKDKKIINEKLQEISKQVEMVSSDFNVQKNLVETKLTKIEEFKNEVFYSIVDAPIQSEEKSKPYTRVRRIEDK